MEPFWRSESVEKVWNWPQVSSLLRHETCGVLVSILRIQQPSPFLILDVHADRSNERVPVITYSVCFFSWVKSSQWLSYKVTTAVQVGKTNYSCLQYHICPWSNRFACQQLKDWTGTHQQWSLLPSLAAWSALSTFQSADHRMCNVISGSLFVLFQNKRNW